LRVIRRITPFPVRYPKGEDVNPRDIRFSKGKKSPGLINHRFPDKLDYYIRKAITGQRGKITQAVMDAPPVPCGLPQFRLCKIDLPKRLSVIKSGNRGRLFRASTSHKMGGILMAKVVVDQDTCIGCEACVGACPTTAISVNDGKASVDEDTCVECGACVSTCPVSAISQ
jgi:ferredoxin